MRANKYLAQALGISRRTADELIESGKVVVNGAPIEIGVQLTDDDEVVVNGKSAKLQKHQYVLLHKPVGYLSSRRSQGDTPTLYELLPESLHHLKPVGRLDRDSSGVMLLTNHGDYAHQLTHPSFRKQKVYEVELDKPLSATDAQQIEKGVDLHDGLSRLELSGKDCSWHIRMREGRNRQIRRTFARLDYNVVKLHRTEFGPHKLEALSEGEWQEVATPSNE